MNILKIMIFKKIMEILSAKFYANLNFIGKFTSIFQNLKEDMQ